MRNSIQIKVVLLLFVSIFASSCANNFSRFYVSQIGAGKTILDYPNLEPGQGEPQTFSGKNIEEDSRAMMENGFVMIGSSRFNSGAVNESQAIQQAKKVKASVVIVYSEYTNTVTGSMPYTTYNPSQTVTSYDSGNVYGAGGSAYYSGTSTYTVPGGSTTQYIPYSVNRYDYGASYWAKFKKIIFGAHCIELPNEVRQQLERNTGGYLSVIVKNSPAFNANVLSGDVLIHMNQRDVNNCQDFMNAIAEYSGQKVAIEIIRKNQIKTISVQLND
jgi:hypothetical protein